MSFSFNSFQKSISGKINSFVMQISRYVSVNDIYNFIFTYLVLISASIHPGCAAILSLLLSCHNKYLHFLLPIPIVCCYSYFLKSDFATFVVLSVIIYVLAIFTAAKKRDDTNHLLLILATVVNMLIVDYANGFFYSAIKFFFDIDSMTFSIFRQFGIFITTGIILILDLAIKNLKKSGLIVFNFIFILEAINYFVYSITTNAFKFSDITLLKTVKGVLSEVQITKKLMLYFGLYVLICILFNIAYSKLPFKKSVRSFSSIVYVTILIALELLLSQPLMYESLGKYGLVSHLILNMRPNFKPSGYEDFIKDYPSDFDTVVDNNDDDKPNVIMIMNESFSDLSVVGDLKTNKDPMPYTRKLMKTCGSGYLYSSVFGNNTVSSEFESLTGIPTGLTARGSEMYSRHLKENAPSLVSYFKQLDYETIGIHPYYKDGYNRYNAWKNFGFNKMFFIEDFKNQKMVRDFYSDEAVYEKIINESEKVKKNNYFTLAVTMQNHATYMKNYKGEIKATNVNYKDANEYLSLIKESDKAMKKLIDYYKKQDKETIIVFFGDHQPMIDSEFYSEILGVKKSLAEGEDLAKMYTIPYFVWSNKRNLNVDKKASINYLPEILISSANLPKTKWYTYLGEIKKDFPIVTENFIFVNNKYESREDVLKKVNHINYNDRKNPLYKLKQFKCFAYKKAFH